MEVIMKKIYIAFTVVAAVLLTACHQPQFIESNADRQGITSLSVIFTSGKYADMEMTRYVIPEDVYESGIFDIPLPKYYPETSDESTAPYLASLKVQAELQPNFKISPGLGVLNLTEEHSFTLTDPKGNSRPITIRAHRASSSKSELVSLVIEDMMISCIIYKDKKEILVPYLEDLSSVSVSGQVSPHAKISKIGGKDYVKTEKFNMNTGSTVVVLAEDGKTKSTYSVTQGMPEKIDMGLNPASIAPLFCIDAVTMAGLPGYDQLAYVSIAALTNYMVVSVGEGHKPVYFDGFNGTRIGEIVLGEAVADVIANDDAEHLLIANFALGGDDREDVKIYATSSVQTAPTLLGSFTNPLNVPVGHRMKVVGNIETDAVIVFTAEGISGKTYASEVVCVKVHQGQLSGEPVVMNLVSYGHDWGSAPVSLATVAPASVDPEKDGVFLAYYQGSHINTDAEGKMILHYLNKGNDKTVASFANTNWNLNCLDVKTFNYARYMCLLIVGHFPQWATTPMLHMFDVTDPESASLMFSDTEITSFKQSDSVPDVSAAGDVCLAPSADGYRIYLYYYDHGNQTIGAYVADCIKI